MHFVAVFSAGTEAPLSAGGAKPPPGVPVLPEGRSRPSGTEHTGTLLTFTQDSLCRMVPPATLKPRQSQPHGISSAPHRLVG